MRIALKVLKWFGIVLGGLIGVIVIAAVVLVLIGGSRVNETYDIQPKAVTVPTEAGSPEDGWPLVLVGLCQECHGDNLQGDVMEDDPVFGTIVASNLTSGRGGIGGTYSDADFVRSIRHGVRPNGKPLILMPSQDFYKLSDADLGEIIAYVKGVPPVDNELPETSLGPLGRILVLLEADLMPAGVIDHTGPRPSEPESGVTAEYGGYMAFVCSVCHGEDLSGGSLAGYEADAPEAPNITPGGHPGEWSEGEFINTIRTGVTPDGEELDSEFMPWEDFALLTDDQLKALWLYLESVPAIETEDH